MREETNNDKIKPESVFDSNSSLLGKKMGKQEEIAETEEKQSTREEKDFNSQSLMKSVLAAGSEEADLKQPE